MSILSRKIAGRLRAKALCFIGLGPICISPSFAEELKERIPSVDQVVAPPTLSGGVARSELKSDAVLDSAQPQTDSPVERKPLFRRLFGGGMTSDDFRKMEFGIIGMVSHKFLFSQKYTVSEVLPGCPAALAGIRPGDIELETNGHVWTRHDDQEAYWKITGGKAGTPVELKVMRSGEIITFHLIRMNVDDVPNPRLRRVYERMLENYGWGEQ